MFILNQESLDPRILSQAAIQARFKAAYQAGIKTMRVEWFDYSLDQKTAQELYLPLTLYAHELGFEVKCLMPMDMGKHLVRNRQLMFVDPLFLYKFKFTNIEFELPWVLEKYKRQ